MQTETNNIDTIAVPEETADTAESQADTQTEEGTEQITDQEEETENKPLIYEITVDNSAYYEEVILQMQCLNTLIDLMHQMLVGTFLFLGMLFGLLGVK